MRYDTLTKEERKYVREIEGVRTIYIPGVDFIKNNGRKNKQAIQHLYLKHYFTNLEKLELIERFDSSKVTALNNLLSKIRSTPKFSVLYDYQPGGIGPGEVILYFLISSVTLGGFKTGDLEDSSGQVYEVKVGNMSGPDAIEDVRLANATGLNEVYKRLVDLQTKLNLGNNRESIEKSKMQDLRNKGGEEFAAIEDMFKDKVVSYFQNKQAILMEGKKSKEMGKIAAIKKIRKEDVSIHRYTNGEFKARIKTR